MNIKLIQTICPVVFILATGCFTNLADRAEIACTTADHCPTNFFCNPVTEKCEPGADETVCALDPDCPFTTICTDGLCTAGCRENGDCGLNRACIDGTCSTRPGACNEDSVCKFGERCNASTKTCVAHVDAATLCKTCGDPRWCLANGDCARGDSCERPDPERYGLCASCGTGNCRRQGSGSSCRADSDCSGSEHCSHPPCTTQGGCGEFGSCTNPANTAGGGNAADGAMSCSRGYCVESGFCESLACDERFGQGPVEGACPRGYDCFQIISLPATGSCTRDEDCGGGRQCRRINEIDDTRFCTCLADADCPDEGQCKSGACVSYNACLPALGLTCEEVRP